MRVHRRYKFMVEDQDRHGNVRMADVRPGEKPQPRASPAVYPNGARTPGRYRGNARSRHHDDVSVQRARNAIWPRRLRLPLPGLVSLSRAPPLLRARPMKSCGKPSRRTRCIINEIAAAMRGQDSLKEVLRCTKGAEQKRLAARGNGTVIRRTKRGEKVPVCRRIAATGRKRSATH